MPTQTRWEKIVEDLAADLREKGDQPLVFVIGAGCSISSGGPSTEEAFKALNASLQRMDPRVREFDPDQSPGDKRAALQAEFKDFAPGIGYLLLASLARSRRVYVVNFNWDLGVEQAAELLEVDHASFDASSKLKWAKFQMRGSRPGIRVLHVHGTLDRNPLARTTETSRFPVEVETILAHLWRYPKVCVGVDLGFELDFVNFLSTRRFRSTALKPWYFARGRSVDDGHIEKLHRMDALRRASVAVDFDFDLFMIELVGQIRGRPYARFAQTLHVLPTTLHDLCLPPNSTLTELVEAHTLCLAAEPQAGATTLGMLVAYLRSLLHENTRQPLLFQGLSAAKAFLGNELALTPSSVDSFAIVVADDVVLGDAQEDASLIELFRLIRERATGCVVLIAPAASIIRLQATRSGELAETFGLICQVREGAPYSAAVLKDFTRRRGAPSSVTDAIENGVIWLPEQCRAPSPIGHKLSQKQPGAVAELQENSELRWAAMMARLVELSAREKTLPELKRAAAVSSSFVEGSTFARYISIFDFEGVRWFQVVPQKRAVLDELLRERADEIHLRLRGRDVALAYELDQWVSLFDLLSGASDKLPIASEQLRRMTSTLMDGPWQVETFDLLLRQASMDSWGATNVAYALTAGWERFEPATRRRTLKQMLESRRLRGCYAVAEAALFLGAAAPVEVWSALESSCWDLLRNDPEGEEISLVVDAFMWRPPPEGQPGWPALIEEFFRAVRPDSPQGGAIRFFSAYHRAGLDRLFPQWSAFDDSLDWNEYQSRRAAWLIEWHFVHGAFSRAVGFRFGRNDKDLLCRSLHEQRHGELDQAQHRLLASMGKHRSTSGWAFHAGCWMAGKYAWLTTATGEKLLLSLLQGSALDDLGVASAIASYDAPRRLPSIRAAAREPSRARSVIDFVERGAVLDEAPFTHAQFQFVHDVAALWSMLDLRLPNVEREHLDRDTDFSAFVDSLESSVGSALDDADSALDLRATARVVEGVRMRTLLPSVEQAIPARERSVSLPRHVLEIMLQMEQDGKPADPLGDSAQTQLPLL